MTGAGMVKRKGFPDRRWLGLECLPLAAARRTAWRRYALT